ncbi:flavoprotein [Chitinophaga sp. LS1]|uniref:flavoprotein n=1 Tax=Chitinophaga sp. LS1 TaxID=3051176 RepID=UPI002AAC05B2|nr:flavoprotein [Chitinophaga sp. LS1]WPV70537.1 flavoprotein [Chitinophaga sp. LS1]
MKTILVCITGAVAAVVMPSYVLQIRKELNARVFIMVSDNATKFVTPYALKIHSGNEVFTNTYDVSVDTIVPHIKLTQEADLIMIMPATANIIAKAANGICDDLISTTIVAAKAPVIFVPSMNENMWYANTVQRNLKVLQNDGHYIMEPRRGIEIEGMKETFGVMPLLKDVISVINHVLSMSNP